MKKTILIVDDEPFIREMVPRYFAEAAHLRVVGVASSAKAALRFIGQQPCDVVLSDIRMPEMDGFMLLAEIRKLKNPPIVVAMTGFDLDDVMMKVLAEGAVGFVGKTEEPAHFVAAVEDALSGGVGLSPTRVGKLVEISLRSSGFFNRPQRLTVELKEDELRVFELLDQGLSNQEIACHLHFAESTIKRKVSVILRKFEVSSRAELLAKARDCRYKDAR